LLLIGEKAMKYLEKILHSGILLTAVIGMLDLSAAWAATPVNTDTQGLAIKGYDPVAYFVQGRPLKGREEFAYQWMGAEWRFASTEHLDLFRSDPERYAPQYGGY
jgi:YHS domain-containing protein